ncbi:hypothetical protein AB0J35_59170 [Nonomuraea angiospora]|uniref:rhamnogalacturonan lyase family protein n=1 Tax=Nonomuraea angiospora TaxID=46172 RepID=UPI0034389962
MTSGPPYRWKAGLNAGGCSAGVGVGTISKWDGTASKEILRAEGTYSNNSTKGTPTLQADLAGDWREEIIWRSQDSTKLRLYTTVDVTDLRFPTLMHDPVYRLSVAWQNVGYNQPPQAGFFIGNGMTATEGPTHLLHAGAPARTEGPPLWCRTQVPHHTEVLPCVLSYRLITLSQPPAGSSMRSFSRICPAAPPRAGSVSA